MNRTTLTKTVAAVLLLACWSAADAAKKAAVVAPGDRIDVSTHIFQPSTSKSNFGCDLIVRNRMSRPVDLYWIDFEGNAIRYGVVPGASELVQGTDTGHRWLAVSRSILLSEFVCPEGTVARWTIDPASDVLARLRDRRAIEPSDAKSLSIPEPAASPPASPDTRADTGAAGEREESARQIRLVVALVTMVAVPALMVLLTMPRGSRS